MICNVTPPHSWFRAAVCFYTAGFQVYTLHTLLAMKGLTQISKDRIHTHKTFKRLKRTLFIWTKHNRQILG